MAYENITFTKANMTIVDGYFYMFDSTNLLVEKTDDGSISFMYPLDTILLTHGAYTLSEVKETHCDGANFWTLQEIITAQGFIVRRWQINISRTICELKDTFVYENIPTITYSSNAFGVEHYLTNFSCTVSGGNDTLCLSEYYDSAVVSGVVLFLGPNENGEREEATVKEVSGADVIVTSGVVYTYTNGDDISFYKSIFVFNDYDGISSSKGTLYRFDAHTGDLLSSQVDSDYKSVNAAVFARVQDTLLDYPDMHTLLYIKGNNAKLRNMSDLLAVQYASTVNDNFTGTDYDLPNTTRWSVINGDPRILNNQLFMNSVTYDNESIQSNYDLIGNFDVQISGSFYGFVPASGSLYSKHYMKVGTSDSNCEVGVYHYADPIDYTYVYKGVDGSVTNYQLLSSGVLDNYALRIVKSESDIKLYYKTAVSGVLEPNWQYYTNEEVYIQNCKLSLGLSTDELTISGAIFDDLIYNSGQIVYVGDDVPYYGIMGIDNLRANQSTIIPVYDVSIYQKTLYRLQDEATYYGADNDWGTRYNYQVSPIRSFLDSITVAAAPVILPANGYNITKVTAVVTDQYGEGVIYKPVVLTDDDPDGYILTSPVYTDIFFGTGAATTYYRAGVIVRLVTIEGTVTQYD